MPPDQHAASPAAVDAGDLSAHAESVSPQPKWLLPARVALVAVVAAGLLAAHQAGLFGLVTDPPRFKAALVELGPRGYLAFVLAYAALQPFGVPGTVFVWAAPLIWPWPTAFALSMTGTMAASVIGFSFARFVARDALEKRIPPWLLKWDRALERHGFWTVALLRLVLWMPQALHTFLGVSRVGFWTHFWGSIVGYAVPLWATAYFGEQLFKVVLAQPPATWAWVGAGVVVVALVAAAWRWRRRAVVAAH